MAYIEKETLEKLGESIGIIAIAFVGFSIISAIFIAIILFIPKGGLSLEDEQKKCQDVVIGTAMHSGIEGYCDTYVGSDSKSHAVYVQVNDDGSTVDNYINWETGKKGKY